MEQNEINETNLCSPKPRLRCADREQEDSRPRLIEDLIEEGHQARIVKIVVLG